MTGLNALAGSGAATLLDFSDNHLAAKEIAAQPLESADVPALVAKAKALADQAHLLLPDADTLIERCVVALLGGHVVLEGPPGTGKTTLAYILAEAFDSTAHLETATADWSTYDVIGGLHPSADNGIERLVPWLGHVPTAALECAATAARHADPDENEPNQAHWLIIDELSRAEIDKAIGPLYTVLGGSGATEPLPLWFGDREETKAVYMPKRFRIIGTMNTVDTNYVYTFSQGLSRRFQFVYVGVPTKDQITQELERARLSAAEWYGATYGDASFQTASFTDDVRVATATTLLTSFLVAIRYDDPATKRPGWPLGTAQMVDVYRQLALRMPGAGSDTNALLHALDLALADRVIPQAGNLVKAQLDRADTWLQGQDLPHALLALQHLRSAAATGY